MVVSTVLARPTAGQPKHAQLKEAILDDIARGLFKPGDLVPSHRSLSARYHMSHMTVRRAITDLAHEGIVYAVQGKGVYVAEPKQEVVADPLVSFHDDMLRRGLTPSAQTLEARLTSASAALARIMGVEPDAPLVFLRRLLLANGAPIATSALYVPHALCPGLLDHELVDGSLFATLRQSYGLSLARRSRTAESVLASPTQAELLGLTLPAPLLLIEQLTYLDTGQAVEYVRIYYRGDRYRISVK
jgi:GntR family transcriptional regulator